MVLSRAFICFLLLSVCTAVATSQFPSNPQLVRWRTVASGTSSTETRQKLQLASERTELENLWSRVLLQNRSQPIVDFSKDRCVIIFLGTRNTGGYTAQVNQVEGGGGSTATIYATEYTPGPYKTTTEALTSPWVMIAVDRTYLDLSFRVQKMVDNSLPSYQIDPLTSYTPLPWDACGYGYGGSWNDPCGFGFDSPYDFQNWCNRNNFDVPYQSGNIDFRQNRLVFISGGDYGIGFGLQIGNVFLQGSETVVQVRRNGQVTQSSKRSYLLVAMGRQSNKYSVEYLVEGRDCFLDQGRGLPLQNSGAFVYQSQRDWQRSFYENYAKVPNSVSNFDYTKSNLGVVYLRDAKPNYSYSVDRVAYRGQTAMVYMKKTFTTNAVAAPYFVFKFDKRIRNAKVVEM